MGRRFVNGIQGTLDSMLQRKQDLTSQTKSLAHSVKMETIDARRLQKQVQFYDKQHASSEKLKDRASNYKALLQKLKEQGTLSDKEFEKLRAIVVLRKQNAEKAKNAMEKRHKKQKELMAKRLMELKNAIRKTLEILEEEALAADRQLDSLQRAQDNINTRHQRSLLLRRQMEDLLTRNKSLNEERARRLDKLEARGTVVRNTFYAKKDDIREKRQTATGLMNQIKKLVAPFRKFLFMRSTLQNRSLKNAKAIALQKRNKNKGASKARILKQLKYEQRMHGYASPALAGTLAGAASSRRRKKLRVVQ